MNLLNNYKAIPVRDLRNADWNYKSSDESLSEKLAENIKRNGQIENLIVRSLGEGMFEVVNGNHRLDVLRKLGVENAICYDLGDISLPQAKRIAIETNETKFDTNNVKLAQLLKELSVEIPIIDLEATMPYSIKELENRIKMVDFDWEQFQKNSNDKEETTEKEEAEEGFTSLHFNLPVLVAEQFETQLKRFKKILYPDKDEKRVSYVFPIEAMLTFLASIPDDKIL